MVCSDVSVPRMPGSHGKRSDPCLCPFTLNMIWLLFHIILIDVIVPFNFPTAQGVSAAVQHGRGEAPEASANQEQRWKWVSDSLTEEVVAPARTSNVCAAPRSQSCSKSTAATTPTPPSAPLWPPPSGSWSALWLRSWARRRTCCWSASARREVGAAAGTDSRNSKEGFYYQTSGWYREKLDSVCWEPDGSWEWLNHTLVAVACGCSDAPLNL